MDVFNILLTATALTLAATAAGFVYAYYTRSRTSLAEEIDTLRKEAAVRRREAGTEPQAASAAQPAKRASKETVAPLPDSAPAAPPPAPSPVVSGPSAAAPAPETAGKAPAEITELYRANPERLYSNCRGIRASIFQPSGPDGPSTGRPALAADPEGDYWVLDTGMPSRRFLVPRPAPSSHATVPPAGLGRLFKLERDPSGAAFLPLLMAPATLRSDGERWELTQHGRMLVPAETLSQAKLEEALRLYRSDPGRFEERFQPVRFGVLNAYSLEVNPGILPRFGPMDNGPYWSFDTGDGTQHAVPHPEATLDDGSVRNSAWRSLFELRNYSAGLSHVVREVLNPARLIEWKPAKGGVVLCRLAKPAKSAPAPRAAAAASAQAQKPAAPSTSVPPAPTVWKAAEVSSTYKPMTNWVDTVKAAHVETRLTMLVSRYNRDPGAFRTEYQPTRFGAINQEVLAHRPNIQPIFGPMEDDGDYWMVELSEGRRYAVPYPGMEVDKSNLRHLRTVFACHQFKPGYRYSNLKLVSPAVFDNWNVKTPGIIEATKGEPDADSD